MHVKPTVVVILGPTGTGKSRLGMTLAQKNNSMILSADSRQVFRWADVGTNKYPIPKTDIISLEKADSKWIVNGVPIYGYDIVTPDTDFSIAEYIDFALPLIYSLKNKKLVYIVGGTGFYIDALLGKVPYSTIKPDASLRQELKQLSVEELFTKLSTLDQTFSNRINHSDRYNVQRLTRYIELSTHAGSVENAKKYSTLQNDISFKTIGLTAERSVLEARTREWVAAICQGPLQDEVALLLTKDYEKTTVLQGIIYKPMVDYVHGMKSLDDTKEIIIAQVRRYIKRQLTWFKRDSTITWFDITEQDFDRSIYELLESS